MADPRIRYDQESDTLYISFAPGERATGIELNDHILLRLDKQSRAAVGLTLFNFSLLAQQTEVGPRSFPLSGLAELSPERRALALAVLQSPPVHEFLTVSAYSPTGDEVIPITLVRSERITSRAA
jgi:uncharacterized protein YuzE